jgi:hypothetical protein
MSDTIKQETVPGPGEPNGECDRAVASLVRARAKQGIDPVTGRSTQETLMYLADMANGLVDVDSAEKAKAAAVCRREDITGKTA